MCSLQARRIGALDDDQTAAKMPFSYFSYVPVQYKVCSAYTLLNV